MKRRETVSQRGDVKSDVKCKDKGQMSHRLKGWVSGLGSDQSKHRIFPLFNTVLLPCQSSLLAFSKCSVKINQIKLETEDLFFFYHFSPNWNRIYMK